MKVIRSSPRLSSALLTVLLALCTYSAAQHIQKGTSSLSVWTGIGIAYGLLLFLYVYMHSMKIVIRENMLFYQTLFERHELPLSELCVVEFQYMHQNVETLFPFLHLASAGKRIEIPGMMFERDLRDLYEWLQKNRP
ncbi:hypothetical protein [Ectobacillus ponti]|uniref:Uncharacterized protein n=1 Tax=Ectobacillus ponti TaxID=2961894 RepID=A0AA41X524_9BACI|nr:hypothetical protein [Ectobacillus ponti]MCP8966995.1 hypothetical protein [Ectobacillus ponti]